MLDVACIGILVADVLAKPVDALPQKGRLETIDSIGLFTGGNAMTAALNLKKMGLASAVLGKVGRDAFGVFLESKLKEAGVDCRGLAWDDKVQTSASVAISGSDGERTFLHCVGANGTLSVEDVNWEVIQDAKLIFLTGTFLLDTLDGKQTVQFLKRCKKLGKTTALDVCWDSRGRWGGLLDDAMPYIDLFMPSIEEAREIAGAENPEAISKVFFQRGVGHVIIKMGKQGCYVCEDARHSGLYIPAYPGVTAVDTTGAGDSFCSGFLAAYAKSVPFLECAKYANAAGALCVMAKGAATGMKSFEEIQKMLEVQPCVTEQ